MLRTSLALLASLAALLSSGCRPLAPPVAGEAPGPAVAEAGPSSKAGGAASPPGKPGPTVEPQIGAAGRFACALSSQGRVSCWGELGGVRSRAVDMGLERIAQISLGEAHGCALTDEGEVMCWGENRHGELGKGLVDSRWHGPQPVIGLQGVKRLTEPPLCAVLADETAVCWGESTGGRAGRPDEGSPQPPLVVPGVNGVADVAVGRRHACAVTTGGDVVCWGDNAHGQVSPPRAPGPPGEAASVLPPARVAGLPSIVQIATREKSTCALTSSGQAICWGEPARSRGGARVLLPPSPVAGLSGAVRLTADESLFCALRREGTVACWGDLLQGGPWSWDLMHVVPDPDAPTEVPGVGDARGLATGGGFSCALRGDGAVLCWGSNDAGVAGTAEADPPVLAPRVVPGVELLPQRAREATSMRKR